MNRSRIGLLPDPAGKPPLCSVAICSFFRRSIPCLREPESGLPPKLSQVGVRNNQVCVIGQRIEDDMEEGNGSTGIMSILLHVEDFFGNSRWIKLMGLSVLKCNLGRSGLVEEHQSKSWLRNQLMGCVDPKPPALSSQQLNKVPDQGVFEGRGSQPNETNMIS